MKCQHFENISILKFDKKTDKDSYMTKNTIIDQISSVESEKMGKLYDESLILLSQASKYKRVNNYILAFGFSIKTKELFLKAEKDKEEIVNDEEFDLIKYLKLGYGKKPGVFYK